VLLDLSEAVMTYYFPASHFIYD